MRPLSWLEGGSLLPVPQAAFPLHVYMNKDSGLSFTEEQPCEITVPLIFNLNSLPKDAMSAQIELKLQHVNFRGNQQYCTPQKQSLK